MTITRGHLKKAVDTKHWDLLDKMLEIDKTFINDRKYYTDGWGAWYGLLIECIHKESLDGVKVLIKHGVDKTLGVWGDCEEVDPIQFAKERKQGEILVILESDASVSYERKTNPAIPDLDDKENIVNRRGDIADSTGLVFPLE
jgi:exopolysaccharide biosynthesis protein